MEKEKEKIDKLEKMLKSLKKIEIYGNAGKTRTFARGRGFKRR